ncbi:MAG: hypothetical protein GQ582_08615 [Methyloprofundus sp.]|nr:hypothetical protein [Methyloprofundus sp.]
MYQCKEITQFTSQEMDAKLPWLTRMEMKLHLLMCKNCQRYAQQLRFINKALVNLEVHPTTANSQLSKQAKQRIAQSIQELEKE